jgi:hypothetical protein
MALLQETNSGLFNGVSQQPASMRLKSQCEQQENAIGELVRGLYKRPPSKFIRDLGSVVASESYVHKIDRDINERYVVIFTDDGTEPIVIYDLVNDEFPTVNYGTLDEDLNFTQNTSVKDYLTFNKSNVVAFNRIRATTIADYTIVVNRYRTCQKMPPLTNEIENVAIVRINGWYDGKAEVRLDGDSCTKNMDRSWTPDHAAEVLYNDVFTDPSKWPVGKTLPNVERNGNLIKLYFIDGRDFDLDVSGSETDILWRTVRSYDELWPASSFNDNERVRILQDTYGESVHYYVQSDGKNWIESTGFDLYNGLNGDNLPHRLVRMSDGSFVFAPCNWVDRKVGDKYTAPDPSFIGTKIEHVFFYQNRLGFLTKSNIILSRPGFYFDFWPTTALEVLDDDPIDIGIATTEVVTLREVLPFNKNLMLRADNQQFIVSYAGSILSPKTIAIDQTTRFTSMPGSRSASIGSNLYFACPNQDYITIREYYVQPDSLVEDAVDVTKQVPQYIPFGGRVWLTAVTQMDYLFVNTSDDANALYVYKYFWDGNAKVQSAWCRWSFDSYIIDVFPFGADLYILFSIDAHGVLCKIPLNSEPKDMIHIDKQLTLSGSYDSGNDQTTFTLPFDDSSNNDSWSVVDPDNLLAVANVTKSNLTDIVVEGDYSDKSYVIGQSYEMLYELTPWYIQDRQGTAHTGILKIRSIQVRYYDTGYFILEVEPAGNRQSYLQSVEETGFQLNNDSLDQANFRKGITRFMVLGESTQTRIIFKNDTHLSCIFQGVTFEGFYSTRAKIL